MSTTTNVKAPGETGADVLDAGKPKRAWVGPGGLRGWTPIAAFVLLVVLFGVLVPDTFLSKGTVLSILNDQGVLALVALGLTVVLLAGEFDLSLAGTVTFVGASTAGLVANKGIPPLLAMAIAVGMGLTIGALNGVLVTAFRVPALVATLATATLLQGLTLWYTNGETIFRGLGADFTQLGRWDVGGLQAPVFYAAGAAVLLAIFLALTPTGRYLHAVGGNRLAARLSGVRVGRLVVVASMVSGTCAGLAGFVLAARNGSATPSAGDTLLLPAFAACFLGSATLRQGEFHVLGTLIGVYLIATGASGFVLLGAPFYTQQLFAGAVLILATASAAFVRRRRGSGPTATVETERA
jgi:ribose transport system permease protein